MDVPRSEGCTRSSPRGLPCGRLPYGRISDAFNWTSRARYSSERNVAIRLSPVSLSNSPDADLPLRGPVISTSRGSVGPWVTGRAGQQPEPGRCAHKPRGGLQRLVQRWVLDFGLATRTEGG